VDKVPVTWVCTGPLRHDRTTLDRDITNLTAALADPTNFNRGARRPLRHGDLKTLTGRGSRAYRGQTYRRMI
jgi:hypothetical protein